jgi:hypothetical protein
MIIQEAALNDAAATLYGLQNIDWAQFGRAIRSTRELGRDLNLSLYEELRHALSITSLRRKMQSARADEPLQSTSIFFVPKFNLQQLLGFCQLFACTGPQDKAFAFLGLVGDDIAKESTVRNNYKCR